MKLNKQQREYAISRLSDKIAQKRNAETPDYVHSKKTDKKALYKLLKSYNLPIVDEDKFNNIWNIDCISNAIEFPAFFDAEHNEYIKKSTEIRVKYEKIQQDILDKLYLCDEAEEALALINNI